MTEEFLQKYKELEQLIMERYSVEDGTSALWALGAVPEFIPFRGQLKAIREIRNFLSHTPSYDNKPLLVPTESALSIVKNLITRLTGPQTVYNICFKPSGILSAKIDDQVEPVLKLMIDRGYNALPIMDGGRVAGVFMASTKITPETDTTFYQLKKHIDLEQHIGKSVLFLPKTASIESAKERIAHCLGLGCRIEAIFITETGKQTEALIGLLVPLQLV